MNATPGNERRSERKNEREELEWELEWEKYQWREVNNKKRRSNNYYYSYTLFASEPNKGKMKKEERDGEEGITLTYTRYILITTLYPLFICWSVLQVLIIIRSCFIDHVCV